MKRLAYGRMMIHQTGSSANEIFEENAITVKFIISAKKNSANQQIRGRKTEPAH